jgi:hypothetical protein
MVSSLLGFVSVALCLSTCGMESIPYYDPPIAILLTGISNPSFSFRHNTSNGSQENFVGYKVYYRLYADQDKANSDRNAILNLTNASSPSPEIVFTRMTDTYKFVPMLYRVPGSNPDSYEDDLFESLIEVADADLGNSVSYTIIFNPNNEWSLSTSKGGVVSSAVELYRSTTNEGRDVPPYKSFMSGDFISSPVGDATSSGDTDYYGYIESTKAWIDIGRGGTRQEKLYLVVFAMGVGRDPEQFWKDTPSLPADFNSIIEL